MKIKDLAWRTMTTYDLAAVAGIATEVHPGLYEAPEILAERQLFYRNGAYLLEIGERPAGYVFSHPWRYASVPALNAKLEAIPANPDTYYLHDLALLPVARRIGAASHIVSALIKHATHQGYPTMSLVAVNGSQGFWSRHGFAVVAVPDLTNRLKSYQAGACYMVKPLV